MPLVVCATPIGNLEDVTLRVLRELGEADVVLCEDTRRTRTLLDRHGVQAKLVSYHQHNEARRVAELVPRLEAGDRIALASDAGLPGVNDPGARLIAAALERGLEVTVLPGPSAVETALVASGLVGERYAFVGYLPRSREALERLWREIASWSWPVVAFESPRRLPPSLRSLADADPTRPVLTGRYWLPGMNLAAGETPSWPSKHGRYGLHHPIVHDEIAYCSWRDACLVVVDVKDKARPQLITHKTWAPPFGGGTHNALPLPRRNLLVVVDETVLDDQEDGFKPIWIFDNQVKSNPISIATLPAPCDKDYLKVGGHFGPHNIHENRPGSLVSEERPDGGGDPRLSAAPAPSGPPRARPRDVPPSAASSEGPARQRHARR